MIESSRLLTQGNMKVQVAITCEISIIGIVGTDIPVMITRNIICMNEDRNKGDHDI